MAGTWRRTLAIVGGGYSGTAVALQMLREPPLEPLRIILIERGADCFRGAAYARRDFPYLLNVPAARMSILAEDPEGFLSYSRSFHPEADGESFLPRALFGDYLEHTIRRALAGAPPHVTFETLHDRVLAIHGDGRDSPARLELASGADLVADDVVLAVGNPPPAPLPEASDFTPADGYLADPWTDWPDLPPRATLLLIGSGLTAADFVYRTARARERQTIHLLSRHGLLPSTQTAFRPRAFVDDAAARFRSAAPSARRFLREARSLAAGAEAHGGDWREVVTAIRGLAPALWIRLNGPERARFLRHVRPYWDALRHRLPEEVMGCLRGLESAGRLHQHAGRLQRLERRSGRLEATWRERGSGVARTLVVDRVINCTGPDYDIQRSEDPLWRSLLDAGRLLPDSLRLGLRTDGAGALLDARGRPASHLFYAGPMLRADFWEATAVTELREHANRLAGRLARRTRPEPS